MIEKLLNLVFRHVDIRRSDEDDVYLRRWFIWPRTYIQGPNKIYLHKFYKGDEDLHLHSHPWRFTSFILWGGYWEESFDGKDNRDRKRIWYGPGSLLKRGAAWCHRVILPTETKLLPSGKLASKYRPCWSLVTTGPKEREWGFITEKGFCHHKNYYNGICWCNESNENDYRAGSVSQEDKRSAVEEERDPRSRTTRNTA